MSQGYIGYQLSQAILNDVKSREIPRSTACIVTQTVCGRRRPRLPEPHQARGRLHGRGDRQGQGRGHGHHREGGRRPWLAPGGRLPIPKRIVEFDAVRDLVEDGYVGRVHRRRRGCRSSRLRTATWAPPRSSTRTARARSWPPSSAPDMLIILTAVEKVCINFNTPEQEEISEMTVEEAREYIKQGQFAPGSMLPKVEACIEYVEKYPRARRSSPRWSARPRDFAARRAPLSSPIKLLEIGVAPKVCDRGGGPRRCARRIQL